MFQINLLVGWKYPLMYYRFILIASMISANPKKKWYKKRESLVLFIRGRE
jgi:hypothetical protein